jgi:exodeoxyribonuclease V alpha subunit
MAETTDVGKNRRHRLEVRHLTRSRKLVVLVGTLKALAIAVKNMDARRRVTLLKQRLEGIG